ncbi:MAG: hypothetical protein ACOY9D_03475 [Pseudomonadota bacterium]
MATESSRTQLYTLFHQIEHAFQGKPARLAFEGFACPVRLIPGGAGINSEIQRDIIHGPSRSE